MQTVIGCGFPNRGPAILLAAALHPVRLRPVTASDLPDFPSINDVTFGEDRTRDAEKLAHYTGEVPWTYLAPHALTGSLYFVDPALKLEDVGAAISANQADHVQAWLKNGDLIQIEALHTAQWENGDTEFEALVVSPFVLCRPV